jgi:LPXTG-motif cell wall-anchored protein
VQEERNVRRSLAAGAAAFVLILALATGAAMAAAAVQDQAQTGHGDGGAYFNDTESQAQTFTAGITGTLSSVSVYAIEDDTTLDALPGTAARPAAAPNLSVVITHTTGGLSSGGGLANMEVFLPNSAGWHQFDFTTPASVVAGTQYAIILSPATPNNHLAWAGVCGSSSYAGGQALIIDVPGGSWMTFPAWATAKQGSDAVCQQDLAFETFVTAAATPTPSPSVVATPPPTGTVPALPATGGDSAFLLLLAGFAAAGAFVTVRRIAPARR